MAAGGIVRDGRMTLRVQRAGTQTAASYVGSLLPHTTIAGLPSIAEAERIANRNAKPALAVSLLSLLLTRTLRFSQAVIRPDYATAPRLSAQLTVLRGIAESLQLGIVLRSPAALDRLESADVYVIDESAGLALPSVEVDGVRSVSGVSEELVVGYALAAQGASGSERGRALARFATKRKIAHRSPRSVSRYAGVTRYRDRHGSLIEIVTPRYLSAWNIEVPAQLRSAPASAPAHARRGKGRARRTERSVTLTTHDEPALRPLWVLREGAVVGTVSFARSGEPIGKAALAALRASHDRGTILYVSAAPHAEASALARTLGIEQTHGGLDRARQLDLVRGLGGKTVWVGDGSDPSLREVLAASTVSISVAPVERLRDDAADVLLPGRALSALPDLIEVARQHQRRIVQDYRAVYAVNLVGTLGAFLARFSSLQAGLLSNLAAGLIYTRHARALSRLASRTEAKRPRLALTAG